MWFVEGGKATTDLGSHEKGDTQVSYDNTKDVEECELEYTDGEWDYLLYSLYILRDVKHTNNIQVVL